MPLPLLALPAILAALNGGRHVAKGDSAKESLKGAALGGVAGLGLGSLVGAGGAAAAGGAGAGTTAAGTQALMAQGANALAGGTAGGASTGATAAQAGAAAAKATPWLNMAQNAGKSTLQGVAMQQLAPQSSTKTPVGGLPAMPTALQLQGLTPQQAQMLGIV